MPHSLSRPDQLHITRNAHRESPGLETREVVVLALARHPYGWNITEKSRLQSGVTPRFQVDLCILRESSPRHSPVLWYTMQAERWCRAYVSARRSSHTFPIVLLLPCSRPDNRNCS